MDELTEIELDHLFDIEKIGDITYEVEDSVQTVVSFEHCLDETVFQRSVYNSWDLLSAVGGFYGALFWIISNFVCVLNTNYFDNSLVKRLYRLGADSASGHPHKDQKPTISSRKLPKNGAQ